MFVDAEGGWSPRPWQPPPRRPRMTKRQERVLLWILGFNAFLLLVAPIGGATVVEAVVAVFAHHGGAAPAAAHRSAPAAAP